jgi:hypothetical protein
MKLTCSISAVGVSEYIFSGVYWVPGPLGCALSPENTDGRCLVARKY